MAYSDQILGERIRDHAPGWEAHWADLCERLIERLQTNLNRYWQEMPGGKAGVDDAVQDILFEWHRKAAEGTLLRVWPTEVDPVSYLVGRFVRSMAHRYARRLVTAHGVNPKWSEGPNETQNAISEKQGSMPSDGPWHLSPIGAQGVTKQHLMAGVQLHGTLVWDTAAAEAVLAALPEYLSPCGSSWPERLRLDWSTSREALESRIEECRERLVQSEQLSTRERLRLERRATRDEANYRFAPVSAPNVQTLTGQTRNTVDVHLKRYRGHLCDLLCELNAARAEISDE